MDVIDVVVTGIGLRCCLGNLSQTWQSLLKGASGIKYHQPFQDFPLYPMGLMEHQPISLTDLTQTTLADALIDAHLEVPLPDCGVVIGSSRGYQGIWEEFARQNHQISLDKSPYPPLSPSLGLSDSRNPHPLLSHWLDTLPHQSSIIAARQLQTTGIVSSPMAACGTGLWAIFQAVELIRQGRCERAIAGSLESPITPLTLAGFQKMGALAKTGCYPFDLHREGLVLGEGGAILVLESAEVAAKRGASVYGKILGFGFTCDGDHLSAPATDNKMAQIAIKHALERSQLRPQDVDYIHPHGTSTRLNDDREARLIQSLFSPNVPLSSTKGATAHTLGASGAIAVAIGLMTLRYQQLPPCVGLQTPEFDLNFVRRSRLASLNHVLCLGFGFGGQNGAILLGVNR